MKIRNGFVSNSSTTSFCIYGAAIDREKFCDQDDDDDDDDIDINIVDTTGHPMEVHTVPYDDLVYVGYSPTQIGDNETGMEFKTRIKQSIRAHFEVSDDYFDWYSQAWRDG